MLPYFNSEFGNPSSHHSLGLSAKITAEESRLKISSIIGAEPQEIVFTSGATEAINLALKGVAEKYLSKGKHIITTQTEHSAVLDVCHYLEKKGFEVEYLSVANSGLIEVSELENKIREDTILVSVIYVNNETGVKQPLKEIGEICKKKNVLFFSDATQAVGKIPIDVNELNIDLMCFSGHKFYGPKGIGGLYRRKNVKLDPLIHGGGHEIGLRSGTLNVPGIVGLTKAFEISNQEMDFNEKKIKELRDEFENHLLNIGNVKLNGHKEKRLFNVSNICLTGIDPFSLNSELKDVAYSQGSACNSSSIKPSHVLKAMGLSDRDAFSSYRFSFGRHNSPGEIKNVLNRIEKIALLSKSFN